MSRVVEVTSEVDRVTAAVRAAASALREAEVQETKATERAEKARRVTGLRRLELGRALYEARKLWPARGPRAKGWGDFLAREGIEQSTAWRMMRDAGLDPDVPGADPDAPDDGGPREIACVPGERMKSDRDRDREHRDVDGSPLIAATAPRAGFDLRLGDWREVLADAGTVDAIIVDPPYGKGTHEAKTTRADGVDESGLTPDYAYWTERDVVAFAEAWHSRCRGWIVALTDSELIPAWRHAYERMGRYAFAPVPCVISGMSVRIQGDGPSSWAVYAMVSRPRELARWGTLPGAYVGAREPGAKGGRGKPRWLMDALVRDYTREGDMVCDPLAGFGVTLLSALDNGRRAIGAELDPAAHAEAMARASASPDESTEDR